jgi:hypothetical protein
MKRILVRTGVVVAATVISLSATSGVAEAKKDLGWSYSITHMSEN